MDFTKIIHYGLGLPYVFDRLSDKREINIFRNRVLVISVINSHIAIC